MFKLCGDATHPNCNPGVYHPSGFRTHPSVCTLAYINWINFDPIPARECLDTSRNRLKIIHSSLNSTPTNISLDTMLQAMHLLYDVCSTCHVLQQAAQVVRVSTMLMNNAFHFSQTNN